MSDVTSPENQLSSSEYQKGDLVSIFNPFHYIIHYVECDDNDPRLYMWFDKNGREFTSSYQPIDHDSFYIFVDENNITSDSGDGDFCLPGLVELMDPLSGKSFLILKQHVHSVKS